MRYDDALQPPTSPGDASVSPDIADERQAVYDVTAGKPHYPSSKMAMRTIRRAIEHSTRVAGWNPYMREEKHLRAIVSGKKRSWTSPEDAKRQLKAMSASGALADPWAARDRSEIAEALERILRYEKPKAYGHVNEPDELAMREFLQIPLSWYRHVQRPYRDSRRPYLEAIQILAYVVTKYRYSRFLGELLWVRRGLLQELLGLSEDAEEAAVQFLLDEGYLTKVIVRGYVPWHPEKKGNYRFLIPVIARLREITWRVPEGGARVGGEPPPTK